MGPQKWYQQNLFIRVYHVCFSIMNYFKWKKGANTTVKIKVKSRREDMTDRGETEEAREKRNGQSEGLSRGHDCALWVLSTF